MRSPTAPGIVSDSVSSAMGSSRPSSRRGGSSNRYQNMRSELVELELLPGRVPDRGPTLDVVLPVLERRALELDVELGRRTVAEGR